jgi:hypothetical protein
MSDTHLHIYLVQNSEKICIFCYTVLWKLQIFYLTCVVIGIFGGKPEGMRPLGRLRRRWEDNIKMDLQEVGGGCGDWMERAQDRDRWRTFVSMVMNFRVP